MLELDKWLGTWKVDNIIYTNLTQKGLVWFLHRDFFLLRAPSKTYFISIPKGKGPVFAVFVV